MELRQLKYFVTVARTLNFSSAAKELYISQGTLSQQIRQLEDELGAELFYRTSHSVQLTEAGEEMLPLAIRTIESSNECRLKMDDLKHTLAGTLNIGLTSSFKKLFNETMKNFMKKYPKVKLNVYYKTSSDLFDMLMNRDVDFILAFKSAVAYEQIESEELFESDLSVVMSKDHPLADMKTLTLTDLERQRLILPGRGLQSRKAFDRFVDIDTSGLDVSMEINEPNIILDLLHGTDSVSILSSLATEYDPRLVAIPLKEVRRKMTGCVHWLKGNYRKHSATAFLEMLMDSAQIARIISSM